MNYHLIEKHYTTFLLHLGQKIYTRRGCKNKGKKMARVTVEDCVKQVSNRFDLVVYAAERVRQIMSGAPLTLSDEKNKRPVLALREIAANTLNTADMEESLIRRHQAHNVLDEAEDSEILQEIASEQEWVVDPSSSQMIEEIDEDDLTIVEDDDTSFAPEEGTKEE